MKNHTITTILSLFLVAMMIFIPFNESLGQEKKNSNHGYKTNETLVIGKKYDREIPEIATKRIADKMEAIKSEFETANKGADTAHTDLKFIEDVNHLKALDLRPSFMVMPREDLTFKILLVLLKKYPYLDVMVTGYNPSKKDAEEIATIPATYLYENGIQKSRLRVNGLTIARVGGRAIGIDIRISLVPSKEMIEKAIEDKL